MARFQSVGMTQYFPIIVKKGSSQLMMGALQYYVGVVFVVYVVDRYILRFI